MFTLKPLGIDLSAFYEPEIQKVKLWCSSE